MVDVQMFKAEYANFSHCEDEKIIKVFEIADFLLEKYKEKSISSEKLSLLKDLLACHLLTLEMRGNDIVGSVQSGTAGSVSVSVQGFESDNENWLYQTQYGAIFHQLTALQSYARYFA